MKKVFLILANGFELVEALTPVDVLRRAGVEVVTVSLNDSLEVESAQKVKVLADTIIKKENLNKADMIVIPGGYPGYINIRENKTVVDAVKFYLNNNKLVGAICGGPTTLGVNNLIEGYNYTCHFSVIDEMKGGNYIKSPVVVDRNLITSQGAGHALDFALELAKHFVDNDTINKVKKGMELK